MKVKLTENLQKIILSVIQLVVAILLLIDAEGFTTVIMMAAGVLIIVLGGLAVLRYVKLTPVAAAQQHLLARGLTAILLGATVLIQHSSLVALFPLLAVLYGAMLLITGVIRVQWTVDMLRMKRSHWGVMAVSAVITTGLALVILFHPQFVMPVMWVFVAVSMIIGAVMDAAVVVLELFKGKSAKQAEAAKAPEKETQPIADNIEKPCAAVEAESAQQLPVAEQPVNEAEQVVASPEQLIIEQNEQTEE